MKVILKNPRLVFNLSKRDIESKYKGTNLGIIWALLNPIIMLSIYSFIFGFVFKAKWGVNTDGNYTLIMFTGLLVHAFMAECIGKATTIYVNNVSYVKKVLFPLEALCWVTVLGALFQLVMGCVVYAVFCVISHQSVGFLALLFPIILAPLIFIAYSISLFLSSLGVYVRDMGQIIAVFIAIMLFMSPVFYPITAVPPEYRLFIYLNPITFIVESLRSVILFNKMFDLKGYLIYWGISIVMYFAAVSWFNKVKKGFSDVL